MRRKIFSPVIMNTQSEVLPSHPSLVHKVIDRCIQAAKMDHEKWNHSLLTLIRDQKMNFQCIKLTFWQH